MLLSNCWRTFLWRHSQTDPLIWALTYGFVTQCINWCIVSDAAHVKESCFCNITPHLDFQHFPHFAVVVMAASGQRAIYWQSLRCLSWWQRWGVLRLKRCSTSWWLRSATGGHCLSRRPLISLRQGQWEGQWVGSESGQRSQGCSCSPGDGLLSWWCFHVRANPEFLVWMNLVQLLTYNVLH